MARLISMEEHHKVVTKQKWNLDPIQQAIGQVGRWQIFVCCILSLINFPISWHQMDITFLAPNISFECSNISLEKCNENCLEWKYDRSIFTETIISQWDLVCSRWNLANWSQSITIFGYLTGNILFGILSDKCGRKPPMIFAVILQLVFGVAIAFSPWFWLFSVLRFILANACGSSASFVITMEIVGPKWREEIAIISQMPFNFGHLSLVGLAYSFRDWHNLQLAVSVPSAILISYYWLIPESPRYLFVAGRINEAVIVLEKAAKHNKLPTDNIRNNIEEYARSKPDSVPKGRFTDCFRTPHMRAKSIFIMLHTFTIGLVNLGVSQYIGHSGGDDIFLNTAIAASFGVFGVLCCIFLLKWFGRRNILMYSCILSGICMLAIIFTPPDSDIMNLSLAVISFIMISIAMPTVYLFTAELFPTVVRNIGMGMMGVAMKIGSMVAPFVATAEVTRHWVPPLVFGIAPLIGAVFVWFLPETKGCQLPETIQDVKKFRRKDPKI